MKRLLILSCLLAVLLPAYAQEYSKALGNNQRIILLLNKSEVKVEGYDGKEIKITALDYEKPPERAAGLRPLYNSAQDNTGIGISVTEEKGDVVIREASNQGGEYILKLPKNARLSVEQLNWNGLEINVQDMKNEVEVQAKNADIRLTGVQGPIIANSTSGEIEIIYSALAPNSVNMISTVASDVDVTMPKGAKADFVLQSVTGEIYTDMDIKLKREKEDGEMRLVGGGQTIEGSTNGGGPEVGIKTISSNIYLRKAE
ncbi:DUF4097 family beta strand repeat-containing protein [Nafulsella turpanensis]|uniref:DUF4097 family beta strand repeat-containing protein n=1 Tax=Nafulsella turpanensis TaxID=1265690 RepID=UPI00034D4E22|nr:hypothetical protein [Nafulsella turpanensis]